MEQGNEPLETTLLVGFRVPGLGDEEPGQRASPGPVDTACRKPAASAGAVPWTELSH